MPLRIGRRVIGSVSIWHCIQMCEVCVICEFMDLDDVVKMVIEFSYATTLVV